MRVGIFGGTFDPIHLGHLIVAEFSADALAMDKVIFVPSKVSPFKVGVSHLFSDEDRLNMVKLSIKGNSRFEVSDFEIKNDTVSYTYITVNYFLNFYSGDELFLIMGSDSFKSFVHWKNYEYILENVKLIVYPRTGSILDIPKELDKYKNRIVFLDLPMVDISSTLIRNRIKEGRSIRYLVSDEVYKYIMDNSHYIRKR